MADEIRREPSKAAISELGAQIRQSDPWHIVDTTTFGLFDHPRRVVEVISSHGTRNLLGALVQRRVADVTDLHSSTVIDRPVFVPNINESWGLVGPVVDWMRERGLEIDPSA